MNNDIVKLTKNSALMRKTIDLLLFDIICVIPLFSFINVYDNGNGNRQHNYIRRSIKNPETSSEATGFFVLSYRSFLGPSMSPSTVPSR